MTKDKALEFSVLREYLRQQGRAYKIIEQDGTAWLADGVDTYEVFDREHALLMILAGITAAMLYVPPEIIQSSASKDVPRALVRRMQERGLDGLQQIIAITADEKRLCETIAEQYDVRANLWQTIPKRSRCSKIARVETGL